MYKRLASKAVLTHPRLTVVEDQVELPGGQAGDYLWFADRRDAVTVIARDREGKILVEKEYSYLPGESLYQFPGGGMEEGESPETAANRELTEELNYYANRLTLLGSYLLDHRRTTARMHIYLGEDLIARESAVKDKYEVDMQAYWLSEVELDALIAQGKVINAAMLASWTIYLSHLRKAK